MQTPARVRRDAHRNAQPSRRFGSRSFRNRDLPAMTSAHTKGKDLFIVDNSVSGWTGLRYLEEWITIAKAFDIATGCFEVGSLLALDGKWQQLEKIRILMGAETTHRTKKALLEAVESRAIQVLDDSIEATKESNPFLNGVSAIVDAMKSRKIE